MSTKTQCVLEHLVETKNYAGLLECGFATKEEIEKYKASDSAQKALDVAFNSRLNETQRSDRFIKALAGK